MQFHRRYQGDSISSTVSSQSHQFWGLLSIFFLPGKKPKEPFLTVHVDGNYFRSFGSQEPLCEAVELSAEISTPLLPHLGF